MQIIEKKGLGVSRMQVFEANRVLAWPHQDTFDCADLQPWHPPDPRAIHTDATAATVATFNL